MKQKQVDLRGALLRLVMRALTIQRAGIFFYLQRRRRVHSTFWDQLMGHRFWLLGSPPRRMSRIGALKTGRRSCLSCAENVPTMQSFSSALKKIARLPTLSRDCGREDVSTFAVSSPLVSRRH